MEVTMKLVILAAAVGFLLSGNVIAQEQQQKIEVQPGNGPTESITKVTPTMKDKCADQTTASVDTQAPGTEATEATGTAVPDMKPESAVDCPDGGAKAGGG
jgi:hypothetical protein